MRNVHTPLVDLKTFIPHAEMSNTSISSVNVGWHIAHALLVISKITESVLKSDPAKYTWEFNFSRILIFTLNKFPRGKGKAPEIVKPKQAEKPDFESLFSEAAKAIEELSKAQPNQYFIHPIFGKLNKKNTFIMLDIHTRHHMHIIRDIIAK